jgi:hypothetical protein
LERWRSFSKLILRAELTPELALEAAEVKAEGDSLLREANEP